MKQHDGSEIPFLSTSELAYRLYCSQKLDMRLHEQHLLTTVGKEAASKLRKETIDSEWDIQQELSQRLGTERDGLILVKPGREKSGLVRTEMFGLFVDDEGFFRTLKVVEEPNIYMEPF